jgi:hypothetical protein
VDGTEASDTIQKIVQAKIDVGGLGGFTLLPLHPASVAPFEQHIRECVCSTVSSGTDQLGGLQQFW